MPISIDIALVQIVRKFALVIVLIAGITLAILTDSQWPAHSAARESIEIIGLILIVACIVGRIYCTLYIGGRKTSELVVTGPYSVSRNPLYFFSIIGAAGVGAQQGSVFLAVCTSMIIYCVFLLVIFKEEQFLEERFGTTFLLYKNKVPRLLPKLALWKDTNGTLNIDPRLVRTTALDACILLLWLPIAEVLEHMHEGGILPKLLLLP